MRKLVLVLIIACLVAPLAMATAADKMNFYGRVCVTTMIEDRDREFLGYTTTGTGSDDSDTIWDMTGARIGFDFKVSDALFAKVEVSANSGAAVGTRHWYGAWKFSDAGTFVVGRTWAPTFQAITGSNLIDGAADVQGSLRANGLQLWYNLGGGTLKVALLDPSVAAMDGVDVSLPKLEMSYNHKFGPVDMNFFGGYQSYDVDYMAASGTTNYNYSVDSHVYGLTFAWDPKPFYVKGAVYAGQNLTEYGWAAPFDNALTIGTRLLSTTTSGLMVNQVYTVDDTDYLGYILLAGFVVNDKFEVEGGYTHIEMEQSWTPVGGTAEVREEGADEYYVIATYQLAPNVYIYPEVNVLSCADSVSTTNGVNNYAGAPEAAARGDRTRIGIYWRINF